MLRSPCMRQQKAPHMSPWFLYDQMNDNRTTKEQHTFHWSSKVFHHILVALTYEKTSCALKIKTFFWFLIRQHDNVFLDFANARNQEFISKKVVAYLFWFDIFYVSYVLDYRLLISSLLDDNFQRFGQVTKPSSGPDIFPYTIWILEKFEDV